MTDKIDAEQRLRLVSLIDETGLDLRTFLEILCRVQRVEDIPAQKYSWLVNALETYRAARGMELKL